MSSPALHTTKTNPTIRMAAHQKVRCVLPKLRVLMWTMMLDETPRWGNTGTRSDFGYIASTVATGKNGNTTYSLTTRRAHIIGKKLLNTSSAHSALTSKSSSSCQRVHEIYSVVAGSALSPSQLCVGSTTIRTKLKCRFSIPPVVLAIMSGGFSRNGNG